jgi:general secretion pathway protein G
MHLIIRTVRNRSVRDERGITILEVLVTLVIIGLLATIGSVQLFGVLGRAKADTARLKIRELDAAVSLFRLDVGRYPSESEGLAALLEKPLNLESWRGPYVKSTQALSDPWGRPFEYRAVGSSSEMRISSLGADGKLGGSGDDADVQ